MEKNEIIFGIKIKREYRTSIKQKKVFIKVNFVEMIIKVKSLINLPIILQRLKLHYRNIHKRHKSGV